MYYRRELLFHAKRRAAAAHISGKWCQIFYMKHFE